MSQLQETTIAPTLAPKRTNHSDGLRTPGLLGQWPLIGLLLFVLGSGLFGALAIGVETHSSIVQSDTQIVNSLHVIALQSSPLIVGIMIFGFYMGEHVVVMIGAGLVVYFLYKRFWPELTMVVIAWGGELILWTVISQYFDRTRPVFDVVVWHQMTAPSFPSGHSFGAVLAYGFLAYLLVPKVRSRAWKITIIVGAVLIILYIGFSRVFVGDHYPTDIVAGYALGIAWASFVYTSVEVIVLRRQKRKDRLYVQQEVAQT